MSNPGKCEISGIDLRQRWSNAGKRVTTWGGSGEALEPGPLARRCANVDGFSVHANVSVPAHRREKLENLCRDMLRPPLAVERLERLSGGRLAYRIKTPWRDHACGHERW